MEQTQTNSEDGSCHIPEQLLLRILQEYFEDPKTRISQPALNAVREYIKTFIREAICRAKAHRQPSQPGDTQEGNIFLEVEDLEKLAPQLLLDF